MYCICMQDLAIEVLQNVFQTEKRKHLYLLDLPVDSFKGIFLWIDKSMWATFLHQQGRSSWKTVNAFANEVRREIPGHTPSLSFKGGRSVLNNDGHPILKKADNKVKIGVDVVQSSIPADMQTWP